MAITCSNNCCPSEKIGIGVRSVSSSASEHGVFVSNPETNSVRLVV